MAKILAEICQICTKRDSFHPFLGLVKGWLSTIT